VNPNQLTRLALLFRQLHVMMASGVPLDHALEVLLEGLPECELRVALQAVQACIQRGEAPSQAFARWPRFFSLEVVGLLRVGEQTGGLVSIFERLADMLEARSEDWRRLSAALVYPAFVLGFSLLLIVLLSWFFLPRMLEILVSLQQEPSWLLTQMLQLGRVLGDPMVWLLTLEVLALIGWTAYRWLHTPIGSAWLEARLISLPLVSWLINSAHETQLAYSMSLMFGCGMAAQDALATLAQCMPMQILRQRVTRLQARISHGEALADAMFLEMTYSKLLCSMVAVGEESGRLPYLLGRCHGLLAEEMRLRLEVATSLIEPFVTVMLGGLIALLALALYGPLSQVLRSL